MRLVRSINFLRVFSHEAAEPPFGAIITPRYSAAGTTEKLAHSGTIFLMALATRLEASGVGSIPRGDERACLDLKIKSTDVPEEVEVSLQSGEVLERLDDRGDVMGKGAIG